MSNHDEEILAKQEQMDEMKKHRQPCNGKENACVVVQFYKDKQNKLENGKHEKEKPIVELGNDQNKDYLTIPAYGDSLER